MKDKLTNLLLQSTPIKERMWDDEWYFGETEAIADHLIANGVTVADTNVGKWISVKEQEQPTEYGTYLCHGYWLSSRRKKTETAEFFGEWNLANNFILTHWMPLPQPPKGE